MLLMESLKLLTATSKLPMESLKLSTAKVILRPDGTMLLMESSKQLSASMQLLTA